jgi:hypothetical protein
MAASAQATGRSSASPDGDRSLAIRAIRFWLLNDTYIDLAVPHEKISAGLPLEDEEKTKVIAELAKCESAIHGGNLDMLELALKICKDCEIRPPEWLVPHIQKAINRLLRFNARSRRKKIQREIHQLRWAAVHYWRSGGYTWDAAYEAACRDLRGTRGRGSEETIRASYKWMNRHPIINSIRKNGFVGEIDAFAREQYENRKAISERLVSIELRDNAKVAPGAKQTDRKRGKKLRRSLLR